MIKTILNDGLLDYFIVNVLLTELWEAYVFDFDTLRKSVWLYNYLMYLINTPSLVKSLFSEMIWSFPNDDNQVFLTFDDGPIPEITPWVLDVLAAYEMKASFFVVGDNVFKNQGIYYRILDEGHSVGNHTYHHLNGWKTDIETYIEDIKKTDQIIQTDLFRPPYGRLKPAQNKIIREDKTIVMWDVLSGDFDQNITPQRCLQNVLENYKSGSIIVFHDSLKAEKNLRYTLPKVLEDIKERGFNAANLSCLEQNYAY